ncbi:KH domain-containing protein [Eubacterium sp. AB3007]|uniref:KH domain-containing protein n=1 Tax=Eubacterium sp. AB3007 TaxID=1392487 RepID=UPI00068DF1D2|nr:KH domain-containing protein [Eubacterium sp. AB3007]
MIELVETIAKSLVDDPEQVVVTETMEGQESILQLQVAAGDMGKVIGKQGRIAKALRTVVKAAATKEKKKVVVKIGQDEEPVSADTGEENAEV